MAYKPAYIWNGTSFDQIGNQAVASLNSYALLSPTVGQTLTNTTLTSPIINSPTISTASMTGGTITTASIVSPTFTSPQEVVTVSATASTGTVNYDCKTQGVLYYTTAATGNFTLNFRGNGSTTLASMLSTGQSITVAFLNTNTGTAYYANAFQVDGTATGVTVKWSGGTAPSSGNINAVDAYSFTIIKTGSSTYTVFAGVVKFA